MARVTWSCQVFGSSERSLELRPVRARARSKFSAPQSKPCESLVTRPEKVEEGASNVGFFCQVAPLQAPAWVKSSINVGFLCQAPQCFLSEERKTSTEPARGPVLVQGSSLRSRKLDRESPLGWMAVGTPKTKSGRCEPLPTDSGLPGLPFLVASFLSLCVLRGRKKLTGTGQGG